MRLFFFTYRGNCFTNLALGVNLNQIFNVYTKERAMKKTIILSLLFTLLLGFFLEGQPPQVKVFELGKGIKIEMVQVPAGKFLMGSLETEKNRFPNETSHQVSITKPYFLAKYETTQEQWEVVMGNNPSSEKGQKLPVTDVSWEEVQEFIEKLNQKIKGTVRLPTEAEWEFACRAGTKTSYSWGDELKPTDANYVNSKNGSPIAVGNFKPNAFGLYDMHGNVWEWCNDWYGEYPLGPVIDPNGPDDGEFRVLRGGSFDAVTRLRSAFRNFNVQSDKTNATGFRLASSN